MTESLRNVMQIVPRLHPEVDAYAAMMRASFERRYQDQGDSWTRDDAAQEAGRDLLSRLPADVPCTVLDIGTGRGRDLELFLAAGHRATGIDIVAPDNWPALRETWGEAVELVETSLQTF